MKKLLKPSLYRSAELFQHYFLPKPDLEILYQQVQRQLVNQYKLARLHDLLPYRNIDEAGFRCYSQFEEDGILLYVLSMIGFKTKKVVEICCGSGDECMSTNLILNHGFDGFLFDGDEKNVEMARRFFKSKKDCLLYQPEIRHEWITRENVNELLEKVGAVGEVDLLSLDIDGNDYWIWETIDVLNPRVCVFETHNVIPTSLSLTIDYQPDFDCWSKDGSEQDYRGVSLAAMTKLSKRKGYRLIGAHRHGFNVFFLRNDIEPSLFPEVSLSQVHGNHWTRFSQQTRWPAVKDMSWIEV